MQTALQRGNKTIIRRARTMQNAQTRRAAENHEGVKWNSLVRLYGALQFGSRVKLIFMSSSARALLLCLHH
jgi:hypothetical protein